MNQTHFLGRPLAIAWLLLGSWGHAEPSATSAPTQDRRPRTEQGRGGASRTSRPGDLFERVAETLQRRYVNREFRSRQLPTLVEDLRPASRTADTLLEERDVVQALLEQIPNSHTGLYSTEAYREMTAELGGRTYDTFGFQLVDLGGEFFLDVVFEGGPADRAGLRRGDRVLSIDGLPPEDSPRLDQRTDDAYLPDAPVHRVRILDDRVVELRLRRSHNTVLQGSLTAERTSGLESTERSLRVLERDGLRLGYVHLWYIQHGGPVRLLTEAFEGPFRDLDGLILDLRGRGGSGSEAQALVRMFSGNRRKWDGPLVLLTHRGTRSAKEVIAHDLRRLTDVMIVGEPTAGAVIPATFQDVGQGYTLMFPSSSLGRLTDALEGQPVQPDLRVESPLPYSQGADPIFEAGIATLELWCREFQPASTADRGGP